uniref:Kinase superfamily protein with octicosapeptide phox bem1p isoform 1 n=2 Tax=Tetraselmis sp. GSL018 TaxID=582737 RepID=A0A061R4G4_9CHLO
MRSHGADTGQGQMLRRRERNTSSPEDDHVLVNCFQGLNIAQQRPGSFGSSSSISGSALDSVIPLSSACSAATLSGQNRALEELAVRSQVGACAKNTVKALCSFGGVFVESTSNEFGKTYQGGTTRLLNLEIRKTTTLEELISQLHVSGINSESSSSASDEQEMLVHYELPEEHGVYVALMTDQDLTNMYEEWFVSQVTPGPTRKLRLFVEMRVRNSPPISGQQAARGSNNSRDGSCLSSRYTSNDAAEADEAALDKEDHVELETLPETTWALSELLKDRMEVIRKSDVTVTKLLGAGGYGEVYLGKWRDATDVAVKCLSVALIAAGGDLNDPSSQHVSELIEEARMLFSLRHPNIVWVYGIVIDQPGDEADTRFRSPAIIAEFMASGSLRAALSRHDQALKHGWVRVIIALDAARGMEYLHSKSIVHFDLKSGNLLLAWRDRRPTCKVADFGLSKQRRQTYVSGVKPHTGTLPWMAPEILKSPETVDEKVDVYSFGIVMWELWTSLEPHAGVMYANLLHRRMTQANVRPPIPGTRDWDSGESPGPAEPAPGWSALMQECWAEEPRDRPSFQVVVARLQDMLEQVRPSRRPQQSRQGS